ncbi:TVP38/TMEM64 family protein [Tautonia sociabilis]|nr:TVP38/TMEM64 family protein [Tautonia sociabilis]
MLALLGLALLWRALPASEWADAVLFPRIERAGAWGYLGFAAVYAVAVVLMAPGSVLTAASGYLFGPVAGAALAAGSATVGASAAFLIARRLAREAIRRRVAGDRRFQAIDRALAERGGWVVLLLRLTPAVPFNVANYALGLTGIRFRSYAVASFVGMLPGSAAYALLGASAGGRQPEGIGPVGWIALVCSTLVAVVVLSRIARRALAEAGAELDAEPAPR